MKAFAFFTCPLWSIHLRVSVFASLTWLLLQPASALTGNGSDHMALLKFREAIFSDPYDILASWNTSTHFCNWTGISCSRRHSQRITSLNLRGYGLRGSISPHIGNLSFLRTLNLQNNSFNGIIPQELGRLFRLQQLILTNNTLAGEIPSNLTSCSELRILSLEGNNLVGEIPREIGSLHRLQGLFLSKNNLTGQFPASIWNLSSLSIISAAYNNLEGNIPEEISHLNLISLSITVNQLSGMIPSSLYNMSSLIRISFGANSFSGSLPANMFLKLVHLQNFLVAENELSGPIPASIVNASKLQIIDMSVNGFVGQIPNLGMLKDLLWLSLGQNNLGSNSSKDLDFLKPLLNCTELKVLSFNLLNLGGSLPASIGNLSNQLNQLYLGGNHISGKIPSTLGNLVNLMVLAMASNNLIGNIPDTFGKFQKMQGLYLWGNKLSGKIPTSIGNITQLSELDLSKNRLRGNIPPSIGNCRSLQILDLSQNNLIGVIPIQVISLSSLSVRLNLSQNSLSGNLPIDVGQLKNIGTLDVSENHLSGHIPGTIGACISLEYLNLQGNAFNGTIPSSLALLEGLRHLDLSRNNLSGSIPKVLQNISVLEYLNLSYNMLDGEVPKEGVFQNASALSVSGNDKLCGGIPELHLPLCPIEKQSEHYTRFLIIVIVPVVGSFLLLSLVPVMYWMIKRIRKSSLSPPTIGQLTKVSYQSLYNATNGFSSSNLIGLGCYGSVYKGNLDTEENSVAIKVLNLQKKGADKSFIAECNALKSIRHRNLVRILTCCSSTDYKGIEFKALVFEYMTNGSLEQWLHSIIESVEQPSTLSLVQRLNILIDTASALHYLHYECEQPIIHCDLKSSNILLDDDMVAHVNDFGLARILSTLNGTTRGKTSTSVIKGTIGYIPPEYGMGSEVSTEGDLYSFGILTLEMLTGRRPTDELFKDGQNLHYYVRMAFPNNLMKIVDPTLIQRESGRGDETLEIFAAIHPSEEKCLISLFELGLACSVEQPRERINMVDVTRELNRIRNAFLAQGISRR